MQCIQLLRSYASLRITHTRREKDVKTAHVRGRGEEVRPTNVGARGLFPGTISGMWTAHACMLSFLK
jgi:hypothetical protein